MPRRKSNVKRPEASKRWRDRRRGAYRPDATVALERIEEKRERLGVTVDDLISRVGMSRDTYWRMRRDRRAFSRTIRALNFALRSIEREQSLEEAAFDDQA